MQLFRKPLFKLYTAAILLLALVIVFPEVTRASEKKKFVVVIDAGHGGTDHGAIENGLNEKDITLAVALKLGNLIKKKLKDTEVVYTRSTDQFISLQKRADIANGAKADLFVSIHCNSVDRSNKNRANVVGATTYVLGHHKDGDNLAVAQRENAVVELDADDSAHYAEFDPSSDESHIIFEMTQKKNFQNSIRFAADVQREMSSIGRVSRGVQQAGFWVLWSTAAPAALIELDFICNPEQARFLNSKDGQEKLAGAIFNAVKKYENYYRMSLGMAQAEEESGVHPGELLAQEMSVTESLEFSTRSKDSDRAVTAGGSAELPAASNESKKTRRTEQSATRKSDAGNHRRRSAAARMEGASRVEQVEIAMTEELIPAVAQQETEPRQNGRETASDATAKKGAKASAKEKKDSSKPGRRDKDKKTGRRGMKQSVNVDYRILLFVSDDELLANDEAFKGLTPVATFRENNQFKYTFGESADRKEMETRLKEIADLFPDARVIKCYY